MSGFCGIRLIGAVTDRVAGVQKIVHESQAITPQSVFSDVQRRSPPVRIWIVDNNLSSQVTTMGGNQAMHFKK